MKAIRFIFLPIIILSLLISPATAVTNSTKNIVASPMTLVATVPAQVQIVGMLIRGKFIYLYGGSQGSVNSDGQVRAMDAAGATLWTLALDTGGEEIVTAGAIDPAGHLWLVGTASPSTISPNSQPLATPTGVLNPEAVATDPATSLRKDLTTLVLWEVDAAGLLVSTHSLDLSRSFIARSAVVTPSGIAIVGVIATTAGNAGFFIQTDLSGGISAPVIIGKSDTEFNAISKQSAGFLLVGSSVDKISGKPLIGTRDAILLLVTPAGKVISIVRSANSKSSRSWQSSTQSLLLAGDAVEDGVVTAVVTKLSAKLAMSWTSRFPSAGPALAINAPISRFVVFASNSSIDGLKSWKPTRPEVIALGLDPKGSVQSAFSAKSLSRPIALGYSTPLGLVILGQAGQNSVSIFHVVTR